MKRILVVSLSLCCIPSLVARGGCPNPEINDRLQELQRCIDTIKVNVKSIQIEVNELNTEIDVIATVSGIEELEEQISISDAMLCSKIGQLDDAGSCLETLIDVPDDVNNLDLNVIELLKTILLELRGCNDC